MRLVAHRRVPRGEGAGAAQATGRLQRSWRWMSAHALAAGIVLCFVVATYAATRWSLGPGVPLSFASSRTLVGSGGGGGGGGVDSGTGPGARYRVVAQPAQLAFAPEIEAVSARTQESAATLAAWPRGQASTGPRTIDTTIEFAHGTGVVDLGLVSGAINVTGWDRNEVHVHATSDAAPITASLSPTRIDLDVQSRHGGDHHAAAFDLTVPFGTRIVAHSVSGDMRVQGVRGALDGRTVSGAVEIADAGAVTVASVAGDLQAHRVDGNLRASSVSGDVELSDVTGDVDVSTVSGDIHLPSAHSRLVHVQSVSGDVVYGGPIDPAGRYEFRSHAGDVTLRLPSDVGAALTLDTFSGDVDTDFPITLTNQRQYGSGHRIDTTLGKGGGHIAVETFSGDITLKRGDK